MAIPAQAVSVLTPSNFLVTSAQGQVYMTWNSAPLSNRYYVSRSTDNVTFTELGNTTSLSYSDTTGVLNTLYYYYVQSSNGTNSSAPTVSQVGQSLKPGQTCVSNLILEAQQRIDYVNANTITTQEWTSMLSQSYKWLYNLLVQKFGDYYFVAPPVSYVTDGQLNPDYQAQMFALPNDFYKLLRCEFSINAGVPNQAGIGPLWYTMRQFNFLEANKYNYPGVFTAGTTAQLRYRVVGEFLQIVPVALANQTIRIWYSPRPNQLIAPTDRIDGIAAFEELIIVDACMKALVKLEEDYSPFAAQKMELLKEIEEAAENRNISEPNTVTDSMGRNGFFGDYTADANNWGWY